ncbi:MAG: imidazolonepropionase [Salibacteraceae bacterium]
MTESPTKLLIKNIRELLCVVPDGETAPKLLQGAALHKMTVLEDAWLAVEDGKISDFGSMYDLHGITDWSSLKVIDAEGKVVMPAWCDSHTHLVFAGSREGEFVDRIRGLSYEDIAAKGGGILNSARKLQDTPEEVLFESALARLNAVAQLGTGAIEIKSGYGLTPEAELKMLRVVRRLREHSPVTIKATFLGAHAFPERFKSVPQAYVEQIVHEMLPQVAEEGLAEYMDVFCERGYFSNNQTDQLLEASNQYGLRPKIHVNQFSISGGIEVAVRHNALSVDHLEVVGDADIEALRGSGTMATLLPSCSFFINIPYAPARQLIDAGLPVALASDYNPGSTPSGNMPLVVAMGCIKLRMTPAEAIQAATLNGAYAMDLSDELGSIAVGKKANLIITQPIPSHEFLPYAFGSNLIEQVILNGQLI